MNFELAGGFWICRWILTELFIKIYQLKSALPVDFNSTVFQNPPASPKSTYLITKSSRFQKKNPLICLLSKICPPVLLCLLQKIGSTQVRNLYLPPSPPLGHVLSHIWLENLVHVIDSRSLIPRLRVIWGQHCLRVVVGPCWPNDTQSHNLCRLENSHWHPSIFQSKDRQFCMHVTTSFYF